MSILGIIVGMALYMLVSLLWFSKKGIFHGKTKMDKPTGKKYAGDLLNAFLISVGLSYVLSQVPIGGFFTGIAMGLTTGIFFIIPPFYAQVIWVKMSLRTFWIQVSHFLVAMALIGGVLMVL